VSTIDENHRWSNLTVMLALTVALVLPSNGVAQEDEDVAADDLSELTEAEREEAKTYFIEGSDAFAEGDYRMAIEEFRLAFEIVKSPEIVYNIGRCYEALGEDEEAVYHYEMYMRFYPESEDAQDVRHRINMIRAVEEKTQEDSGEGSEDDEEEISQRTDEWWSGMRLDIGIGATFPVMGEWEAPMVPLMGGLYFATLDWLYIGAMIVYHSSVYSSTTIVPGDPEGMIGLFLGFSGMWPVSSRIDLTARLGIQPMWITRSHYEGAIWLAIPGTFGIAIEVWGPVRVLVEAICDFGPVFNPSADKEWGSSPASSLDLGGLLTFEYIFW
jgi:hypothetical protein